MAQGFIKIGGAREHNLKNLTLSIPRDRLVVITGLSGSGKSSLAFDTIYAEGQRKYVESLSAYARQFWDQSAFDHRHDDGNLRLSAAAFRARGPAALPGQRRADRGPDHQRHCGQ